VRSAAAPGDAYPIRYRSVLTSALADTCGERMKSVRSLRRFSRERTAEMTLSFTADRVEEGVDAFDVDLGGYENWWL
jgi:2-enoate reductase